MGFLLSFCLYVFFQNMYFLCACNFDVSTQCYKAYCFLFPLSIMFLRSDQVVKSTVTWFLLMTVECPMVLFNSSLVVYYPSDDPIDLLLPTLQFQK